MDIKTEKEDTHSYGNEFKTPIKSGFQTIRNKSTTANPTTKDCNESVSFEKLIQRHTLSIKHCITNLNDILGSDVKFRSPGELLKLNHKTPVREKEKTTFTTDSYDAFDSETKFQKFGFNFDFSLRRDQPSSDQDIFNDGCLYRPFTLEAANDNHHDRHDYSADRHSANRNLPWNNRIDDGDSQEYCNGDDYRKRKRKNNLQLKILKNEFSKSDHWNKEKITYVAQITGLSESQVYKWCWDQKKKIEEQESQRLMNGGKGRLDLSRYNLLEIFKNEEFDIAFKKSEDSNLAKRRPETLPFSHSVRK